MASTRSCIGSAKPGVPRNAGTIPGSLPYPPAGGGTTSMGHPERSGKQDGRASRLTVKQPQSTICDQVTVRIRTWIKSNECLGCGEVME